MWERLKLDPLFRRRVILAAILVAVVFGTLVLLFSSPDPDDADAGGVPRPEPTQTVPTDSASPSPSPTVTELEPPRPTEADYRAAADAAIGFLTAVHTWDFPIDYPRWQAEVAKYSSATSPYLDLLIPTMSLQMMKQCERIDCSQSAVVKRVGSMQYLGDGGFRGRFTVQVESNFIQGGDAAPRTWEVEVFGTPPTVNFAYDAGTAGGADGR